MRVEVWDKDQVLSDDYEGGFTLNWWMLDTLVEHGAASEVCFPLRRGHGLRKNVPVGGSLVLDIKLSNYAKALAEQGKLREVFPDTPAGETIVRADDCAVARVPEGAALRLPPAPDAQQQRRRKRASTRVRSASAAVPRRTDVGVETYPGTVFLLDHYLYAYGVTRAAPLTVELAYADVTAAEPRGADAVLVTTARGWRFVLCALAARDAFLDAFDALARQAAAAPPCQLVQRAVPINSAQIIRDEALSLRQAPGLATSSSGGGGGNGGCDPATVAAFITPGGELAKGAAKQSVPFKVYLRDHSGALRGAEGMEPCPVSLVVGVKPSTKFRHVVDDIFLQANLPHELADRYRLYTVLPGHRKMKMARKKLTSKWTVSSCVAQHLVTSGCVLELAPHTSKKLSRKHSSSSSSASSSSSGTGSGTVSDDMNTRVLVYVAERGSDAVPYPIVPPLAKEVVLPRTEALAFTLFRALGDADPSRREVFRRDNAAVFLATLSAEPEYTEPVLIPVDLGASPDTLYLVDDDVLVIKRVPLKTTVAEKYPALPENLLAGYVAAMCYAEPLLLWKTGSSSSSSSSSNGGERPRTGSMDGGGETDASGVVLPSSVAAQQRALADTNAELMRSGPELLPEEAAVASMAPTTAAERATELRGLLHKLDVPDERAPGFLEGAARCAEYGTASLMCELEDRLRNLKSHAGYDRDAFASEDEFQRWCTDERENVLSLMRHVLFRRQRPFSVELHVTLVSAAGIVAADMTNTSDAWVLMALGAQRQSSDVCLKTLTPRWNQSFVFTLASIARPMSLCLYDWNALTAAVYLGTATLDFLENIELLDGNEHELCLPIDTRGTLVVRIQALCELMPFLTRAAALIPAPAQPAFARLDFRACYKLVFTALVPHAPITEQSPWILQEMGARFGVSSIFCSTLKMSLLLALEPQFSLEFAACLAAHARNFAHPRAVPTLAEAATSHQLLVRFREYCYDTYLPGCFKHLDMPIPAVNVVIRALLESYLPSKSSAASSSGGAASSSAGSAGDATPEIDSTSKKAFCDGIDRALFSGVKKNCKDICKGVPWDDADKVGGAFAACVAGAYTQVLRAYERLLGCVIPAPYLAAAHESLVQSLSSFLESDLAHYCDVVLALPTVHTRAVLDSLRAVDALAAAAVAAVQQPLAIPSSTGLLFLWVRRTKDVLLGWVHRSVELDTLRPVTPSVTHSSAVVDVCDACTQVVDQLRGLTVQDVYVWLQAGELLVAAMSCFFGLEADVALQLLAAPSSTHASHARHQSTPNEPLPPATHDNEEHSSGDGDSAGASSGTTGEDAVLKKVCVVLSNIEKGQSMVDQMVTSVEEGITAYEKAHADAGQSERTQIVSESLSTGVSNALKSSNAARDRLLQRLATLICAPVESNIRTAVETATAADISPSNDGAPTPAGPDDASDTPKSTTTSATATSSPPTTATIGFTEEMISTTVGHFDHVFEVACDGLSKRVFRELLLVCWETLMGHFAAAAALADGANRAGAGMHVRGVPESFGRALAAFLAYFSPAKNGVPRAALEASSAYGTAARLVALYTQTTEQLIGLVRTLRAGGAVDERLQGTTAAEAERLLAVRSSEGDLWARAYDSESSGSAESQRVREHFSLPPSELLLNRWSCSAAGRRCCLYLMSRHLCLDGAFTRLQSAESDLGTVVMLEQVAALRTVRTGALQQGLQVVVADAPPAEQPPLLSFFAPRCPGVLAAIAAQARLVGNPHFTSDPASPSDATATTASAEPQKSS